MQWSQRIKAVSKYAISITNLNLRYNYEPILSDISLNIPQQKMIAVLGPNGAGKSSLLKAMIDLIERDSGEVRFFDAPLHQQRMNIAYVPQRQEVQWDFPVTVGEVVEMGRLGYLSWWQRLSIQDKDVVNHALETTEMMTLKDRQISQLSGGQQQRMFIARALAQQASIYLLDEPFAGIDVNTEKMLVALFKKLVSEGATIVTVHHDIATVKDYFDHAILLNQYLIAQGDAAEIISEKNIKLAYTSQEAIQSAYNLAIKNTKDWPKHHA